MTPWIEFTLGALCATTVYVIVMRMILASAEQTALRQDAIIRELYSDLMAERREKERFKRGAVWCRSTEQKTRR